MNKYLMVYSDNLGSREQIKEALNEIPEVVHWRFDMPNSFYISSESSAEELMSKIRALRGGRGRCLMVKMDQYYGWLPVKTWEFIKKS